MHLLPQVRTENIVVQHLKTEVLIYDLTTNQAFCLNDTSAKVFNACDGKQTYDDLKRKHKFSHDLIHLALGELKKNNLLIDYENDSFKGLSRREAFRRVGLASMIALPVVASMIAPNAAHAASSACPTGSINPGGTTLFGRGETCQCSNTPGNANSCNTTPGGQNGANTCRSGCVCNANQPLNCFGNTCLGTCN